MASGSLRPMLKLLLVLPSRVLFFVDAVSALRTGAGNCSGAGSGTEEVVVDLSEAAREQQQDNGLGEKDGGPARDGAPGESWAFVEHRTMAEVIAAERLP